MYKEKIRMILARKGYIGYDPRHIEGYMRIANSTLDGLSSRQFESEVSIGIECINYDGIENAESLAKSFGL